MGTRPEAIKLSPIVHALDASDLFRAEVIVTAQHRSMLDQVLELFDITPARDLDLMRDRQTLTTLTARALEGLSACIESTRPDAVVVQGDTTTTFVAALAAFYARVPVVHVEAGLRTYDRWSPFPEELNRRLTTQLASLHLAPTETSATNLRNELVDPATVFVTGNSVIDALLWVVARKAAYGDPRLEAVDAAPNRLVVVTAHRRESWGEGMAGIGRALHHIASSEPDVNIVFPIHRNPAVREVIVPLIDQLPNVHIVEPLSYGPFARLMQRADVLLTDSGGVQEEGPSLGTPVLVMRDTTERPEAIAAGAARLVGTDEHRIVHDVLELLHDPSAHAAMANAVNPYGDGQAARRTVQALAWFFRIGARPEEFDATSDRSAA
jgi:UDP-N-acetylglucosamine 2-epimerase (non-hydrolysing)